MRTIRITLLVIFAVVMLLSLASQRVEAAGKSLKFKSTFSGTSVSTALDLDGDSCTGTPPVCTDLSDLLTFAGKQSGGIEVGQFTGQGVSEIDPVSGTGCLIAPGAIKSCTLGAVTNACEFQKVGVESIVVRYSSSGDILTGIVPSGGGTACIDFSTGNFAGSDSGSLTGGSGKFAGVTGTFTTSFNGQTLSSDPQGHSFGWFQATLKGTMIKP
jgi:hypothetical protein